MNKNEPRFSIGYLRVPDVADYRTFQQVGLSLEMYCKANGIHMPVVFTDNIKGSENFTGFNWECIEKTIQQAKGQVASIIIPSREMLTKDVGLYLLKEKELKDNFGVTIEVAEGKALKLDLSKGINLN